jgi:hypothetical protein
MKIRRLVIGVLAALVVAPVIGLFIPFLELVFPLAIAFRVPPDEPPFSESLLPLLGTFSFLLGSIGFAVFALTKSHHTGGLRSYCYFMITYSALASCVWLVFFGSRFIRYFPITEYGFYSLWGMLLVRHILWLTFLYFALKCLRQKHVETVISGNEQITTFCS